MVRGSKIKYSYRVGQYFSEWLKLVGNASITYEREDLEVDDKEHNTPRIRFNFQSIQKYVQELENAFESVCENLEYALSEIYNKLEKLTYLTTYITELHSVANLLEKDASGSFHHRLFHFSNISKNDKYRADTLDEDHFQECYFWMNFYLQKMKFYLDTTKENIELIPQNEIPLSSSMLLDPNTSTAQKPIAFFDWFFLRNGLSNMKYEFYPDDDDYYRLDELSFDSESEIITWMSYDNENDVYAEQKRIFKEELLNTLFKEFLRSRQYIDEHIDNLMSSESINLWLKLITLNLAYYSKQIKKIKLYQDYEDCSKIVHQLKQYIYDRYGDFCPKANTETLIKLSEQEIPSLETIRPVLSPNTECMNSFTIATGDRYTVTTILWKELQENNLIGSDIEIDSFSKAFDGSPLYKPLGIKWISVGKNKIVNKQSLLHLLNLLGDQKIILEDTSNAEFLKRVELIFCDAKGERLENLKVSNANSGKSKRADTADKRKIVEIVSAIKNIIHTDSANTLPKP